jgi:hypothetical protein
MNDGPGPHRTPPPATAHESPAADGIVARALRNAAWIRNSLSKERIPDRLLSYRQVVGYLATHQPEAPFLVRGALLRRERVGGWLFRLLYLDEGQDPMRDRHTGRLLGRSILARDCDAELRRLFTGRDLIIFE